MKMTQKELDALKEYIDLAAGSAVHPSNDEYWDNAVHAWVRFQDLMLEG